MLYSPTRNRRADKQDAIEYRWLIWSLLLISVHAKPSCEIDTTLKKNGMSNAGIKDCILHLNNNTRILIRDCALKNDVLCNEEYNYCTFKVVRSYNKEIMFIVRNCLITEVKSDSFAGLPHLRHLDMSKNKIKSLELEIFNGVSKMNHLNLSFNSITKLPSNLFHPIPNILNLDLSENTLSTIEVGLFDPLTKLKVMNLSSNLLKGKDLNPHLFDQNRQITILDLSRNDMSVTPDNSLQALQSLEYLGLKGTFLKEVPTFATGSTLKMLKHLDLSANQIQKIEKAATFVNLDNLEILNLSENNIEYLNEHLFQPLRKLRGIILQKNKLNEIPRELFQNIPKLVNLDLANNYIEHFTIDALKGTSVNILNLSKNRITFMPEKFCLQLRNIGVVLSWFSFMPNPWQCRCLNELLQEVKSLDIEYNANYFDGKLSVCTVSEKFLCQRS